MGQILFTEGRVFPFYWHGNLAILATTSGSIWATYMPLDQARMKPSKTSRLSAVAETTNVFPGLFDTAAGVIRRIS